MKIERDEKDKKRFKVTKDMEPKTAERKNKLKKLNEKSFSQLNTQQKDELLLFLLQNENIVDEAGIIHVE